MDKLKKMLSGIPLAVLFAAVCFLINLLGILLTGLILLACRYMGLGDAIFLKNFPVWYFAILSLVIGTIVAILASSLPLKPIRQLREAADRIADGDYSVSLKEIGPGEFKQLRRSFNHMARELRSVEMLRSDFIGNFSHEFKTPIVSICGFAKALKWDDLTPEERDDYLNIIIAESQRLAELSTNVLNLSKLEQQAIVTDKIPCNITEQIRLAISVIDGKWASKQINYQFDAGEVFVCGNEEMLKQVWINLMDNAVKFSPDGGTVKIEIRQNEGSCEIAIHNQADTLSQDAIAHIFDKFYQSDLSHATKGNGLGLTIVRRILELHRGTVTASQADDGCVTIRTMLSVD